FPDQIALRFNDHVRHHLVHFPDITVRPGGMTFGSGHSSVVPQADRYFFSTEELRLELEPVAAQVELGEPLQLGWTLTNTSAVPPPTPTDISIEAQHTYITVTNPHGAARLMRSFIIRTGDVKIDFLPPGDALHADTRVFWSSQGFAFETPGRYQID